MALFTDGGPATIEDLKRYDSSAEDLARDTGIDLDAKLAVAAEEVGQQIFRFLLFQTTPKGFGANLLLNLPPAEAARQRLGLTDVVVTPSLRRWHALASLVGLYRDAYSSEVTDRFRLKWVEYDQLAKDAADYTFTTGIGLASNPVPKAPMPTVTQFSALTDRVDSAVRITWVGSTGAEGAPSDVWQGSIGAGDQFAITVQAPSGVTGWNIYIGASDGIPELQNATPIALGASWTKPDNALRQGKAVVEGQVPDYLVMERRVLPRG